MIIPDQFREETIRLMVGFMKDQLYKEEDLSEMDLEDTAAIYFDIVNGIATEVEKEDARRAAIAAGIDQSNPDLEGLIDASSPTQVDLMGGPKAINESANFKR
jgi:hypothetical protein